MFSESHSATTVTTASFATMSAVLSRTMWGNGRRPHSVSHCAGVGTPRRGRVQPGLDADEALLYLAVIFPEELSERGGHLAAELVDCGRH